MLGDIDWGVAGLQAALDRGDVIVVVDTLSFSSAVVTAVEHEIDIFPCSEQEAAQRIAQAEGAEVAVSRGNAEAGFSLSPLSFVGAEPGTRVALLSANGAACAELASGAPHAYIGCLLNAQSVAAHVAQIAAEEERNITVIAAGEHSEHHELPGEDRLLFAIEDYLGCGAILSAILGDLTAEAAVCANAFTNSQEHLDYLLRQCMSGRQLIEMGYEADVGHCAQVNIYAVIPQIRDGRVARHDAPDERGQPTEPEILDGPSIEDLDELEESIGQRDEEEVVSETPLSMDEWPEELVALHDEAVQCTRCRLSETRENVVFGEGNPGSKLMLVGEGPGDNEDRTGRPFVGRAGQLLDEALERAEIQREDIWITNIVKCRACEIEGGKKQNRAPRADEVKACQPWLEQTIELIEPTVILCIGSPSANAIIHKNFKITQERGEWFTDSFFAPNTMAALHPAYILRQHGDTYEEMLQTLVDDLRAAYEKSKEDPPAKPQLTLF